MEQTQTNNTDNPQKEIDELLKGYQQKVVVDEPQQQNEEPKKKRGRPKKNEEPEIQDSTLISGALFLLLIDMAIPALLTFVNNKMTKDKRKKMKGKQLKLSKEQRDELAPIADEAVKQLMLKASPLTVLVVSLLGIYGLNFLMLKDE